MDIQQIIDQVTSAAQGDSDLMDKLTSNPVEAITSVVGDKLDPSAIQDVVSGIAQGDNGIDLGDIAGDIEKMFGDNIADAAGDLLGGLFGKK